MSFEDVRKVLDSLSFKCAKCDEWKSGKDLDADCLDTDITTHIHLFCPICNESLICYKE